MNSEFIVYNGWALRGSVVLMPVLIGKRPLVGANKYICR